MLFTSKFEVSYICYVKEYFWVGGGGLDLLIFKRINFEMGRNLEQHSTVGIFTFNSERLHSSKYLLPFPSTQ